MKLTVLKKLTVGPLRLPVYGDDEKSLSPGTSLHYVTMKDYKAALADVRGTNVEIGDNGLTHERFTPFVSVNADTCPATYLPTPVLPKAVRKIIKNFAASNDIRYYLNGAFFDFDLGNIVATDGHRMAVIPMASINRPGEIAERAAGLARNRIIPVAPLMDAENFKGFWPVDGVYPNYPRVIPDKDWRAKFRVQFDCDAIKYYIDKKVEYNGLILSGALIAKSSTDDRLQQKAIGSIVTTNGNLPKDCAYNVKYLLDMADACDGEYVSAYFYKGSLKVEKDDGTVFVVMVMRV